MELERSYRKGFEDGVKHEQYTLANSWEMFCSAFGIDKEMKNG